MNDIFQYLFIGVMIVLMILIFCCLIRACKGPTVADRLVSVNMMGTMVMVIIAALAILKDEGYLVDISMIYAMISFLAVIVLSKVIIGIHKEQSARLADLTTDEDNFHETKEKTE